MERFYKKYSRGSSLVFVIIAVAFVGILGSVLLNVTLINIETKGTDRTVKKSFYNTETMMDKLNIGLENISSDAMKDAYITLMENYTGDVMNTTDQAAIQSRFGQNYIEGILKRISSVTELIDDTSTADSKIKKLPGDCSYKIEKIQDVVEQAFLAMDADEAHKLRNCIMVDGNPTLELKFDGSKPDTDKYLILKNIKVKLVENTGTGNADAETSTWITTDIKFTVPILRFEGGGTYPNFTEYSIIGDQAVTTEGTGAHTIDGSLYAGYNGFNVEGGANVLVKRKSANVITRDNVNVTQGSELTLGEKADLVNVYARNYVTSRNTDPDSTQEAKLNVYANSYIMDDLSMDAPYSTVYFGGENFGYYGYSFNKDNTTDTKTELDSRYSSAILINGKNSSLHMDDIGSVLLGGRAYISRNQQKMSFAGNGITGKDILMGESLSIKCDQNYYLVSEEHMKDGYSNPMKWEDYAKLGEPGRIEVLSNDIIGRSSGIGRLLKTGTGQSVVPYVYNINNLSSTSGAMVYFYYNFKSQSAADTFYNNYFDKTDLKKQITNKGYLRFGEGGLAGRGITISPNVALFASSNYMTFENNGNSPGNFETHRKNIDPGDEDKLKQQSIDYAITYKALQMELSTENKGKYEATHDGSDPAGTNGFGMSSTQLTGDQIFDGIMTHKDEWITTENPRGHLFIKEAYESDKGYQNKGGNSFVKAVPVEVNGIYVWAYFVVNKTSGNERISLSTILGTSYNDNGVTRQYNPVQDAAIVVANCHVDANTNLRGLIISDSTVYLKNGSQTLTAEPSLLREMFRKQRAEEGKKPDAKDKFITYFDAFSGFVAGKDSSASDSAVDISRYITYSNWKKNADEVTPSVAP